MGGIVLPDDKPYGLTTAQIFLPPVPCSSAGCDCGECVQEDDYAHENEGTVVEEYNAPDERQVPPRRNCDAISRDAEFVVTFMDEDLRRFSRVVRLADHQDGSSEGQRTSWKAAYVNLDHNWALIDMEGLPAEFFVNTISLPPDFEWEDDDDESRSLAHPNLLPITKINPFTPHGPMGLTMYDTPPRLLISTPRFVITATKPANFYYYSYLAGTNFQSRKNTIVCPYGNGIDYEYGDNGSWVVNPETGEFPLALPAGMIIENIRRTMDVEVVKLPKPPRPNRVNTTNSESETETSDAVVPDASPGLQDSDSYTDSDSESEESSLAENSDAPLPDEETREIARRLRRTFRSGLAAGRQEMLREFGGRLRELEGSRDTAADVVSVEGDGVVDEDAETERSVPGEDGGRAQTEVEMLEPEESVALWL
ncbi:hypothetical protein H2200_004518 [Cladophialophora chaetospira]|uniref:Uncharacterized protein n=1 Tax=Cladophialophora chaetospira TaxID=386627 RepID=A0AA38XDG7_9EURO|nr:hypothetical protein H2200_004518 [Cladophialophora chaetospira]